MLKTKKGYYKILKHFHSMYIRITPLLLTPLSLSLCYHHPSAYAQYVYVTTNVIHVILTWQNALLTFSHAFAPIFITIMNIFSFSSREIRARRDAELFRTIRMEWYNPARPATVILIQQNQRQFDYSTGKRTSTYICICTWKGWSKM